MTPSSDERWMKMALRLAAMGVGRVSPNPMVGAVVVAGNTVVGKGWHRGQGSAHAETIALAEAADASVGATLYVSLEPCTHHGNTPPCVDAVIASKVRRVVVAMRDPDVRVAGNGIETLEASGIEVTVGTLEAEAARLNEAYVTHRNSSRPFVTYKFAMTIDGKTSATDGTSKWITGEEAREDVQRLRAMSDAICVGIGTVLTDDPSLMVRGPLYSKHPLRVIVDPHARTPIGASVFDGEAPTTVFTLGGSASHIEKLQKAGVRVITLNGEDHIDIEEMLKLLAAEGIVSLLLEGGPRLAASFEAAGLIDRYLIYVAPKLLGSGAGVFEGWTAPSINEARKLHTESVERIGEDIKLVAYPMKESN